MCLLYGFSPLLPCEKCAIWRLAEVLLNERELRVGGAPNKPSCLLNYALIIFPYDFGRIGSTDRVWYARVVRCDKQDARGNRQRDILARLPKAGRHVECAVRGKKLDRGFTQINPGPFHSENYGTDIFVVDDVC